MNAFERESIVYGDMIPKWQVALEKANIDPLKVPECYNVDKKNNLILLQNLKTEGFLLPPIEATCMPARNKIQRVQI